MRTLVITLTDPSYGDFGPRRDRARRLRESVGVHADPFYGLHAARLGIVSTRLYALDHPEAPEPLTPKNVGTWLSHRALWAACLLLSDDLFLLLEDDALFPPDWAERTSRALANTPDDWDLLNLGACCTEGKPQRHVAPTLYEIEGGPMCLHAYFVRRRALKTLLETQDAVGCTEPIDISVLRHSFPKLRVYAVLPRIVQQLDLESLAP